MIYADYSVRYNPPPVYVPPPPPPPPPLPPGDGKFADQIAGQNPQKGSDLQFAQMANDVYTQIPTDVPGTNVATGTQSGKELEAAGWDRLQPQGDHLVDNQGREIPIDPSELEDPTSGFRAAIYQNDKGQYVVAFAGTNDWGVGEGGDSDDNLGQGAGFQTQEYSQAMALGRRAEAVFGDGNVAFAGQSLGGGLASAATLATDSAGVTFNSSGLSNDTLEDLGFNPNAVRSETADSGQIRRYVVNYEPLNTVQQDVPILNMAPDAVGREFRVDVPDGISPFNPAETHGGGGDGASYVEALRTETPYRPDGMFLDAGKLEDNTLERGAELVFNGFGSILENGSTMVGDVIDDVSNKADDIGEVIDTKFAQGDYVEGSFDIAGDVIEGGFNAVGDMGKGTLNLVGDLSTDVANFGGGVLRDLGEFTGLETPFNGVASFVEGTGEVVDTVAEFGGDAVGWVADGLGTVSEGVVDLAGDAAQGLTDVAEATGEAISDGVDAGVNWVKSWF